MGFTIVLIKNRPVPGREWRPAQVFTPLSTRKVGGDGAKVRFCETSTVEGPKGELLYV